MINRLLAAGVVAFGALGMVAPALAKEMSAAEFLAANADKDQTLSMDEVEAYAKKKFAEIDSDGDKTLDAKELADRVDATGLAAADTDKDKTVDETEFVGYAQKLFKAANTNADKTLSARELETPAGRKLRMLLQ